LKFVLLFNHEVDTRLRLYQSGISTKVKVQSTDDTKNTKSKDGLNTITTDESDHMNLHTHTTFVQQKLVAKQD